MWRGFFYLHPIHKIDFLAGVNTETATGKHSSRSAVRTIKLRQLISVIFTHSLTK